MKAADLRRIIFLFPHFHRYGSKKWTPGARFLMTGWPVLPDSIERPLRKILKQYWDGRQDCERIQWVDLREEKFWTLHARLRQRSINYILRKWDAFNRWPKKARGQTGYGHTLPYFVRYKGQLICWNGTHRSTLSFLAGRKVRATVLDLDQWIRKRRGNRK